MKKITDVNKYIKENTFDKVTFNTDEWGIGQIHANTIRKMVEVCHKHGVSFKFYKEITAIDDETWKLQTIRAGKDYLFAIPIFNGYNPEISLSEFWKEVEKEN